jgi:Na+-driven multidrug efflux pump
MFFIADKIYLLWVGPTVIVPKSVSFVMTLYVIISLLGSTTNTFVNGTGKVRLQLYTAVISIIITIPLAFLFCKVLNFGPAGVIAATLCTTLPTMILWRLQYKKIINGNATGIWIK